MTWLLLLPLAGPAIEWRATVPAAEVHPSLFCFAAEVPELRRRLAREPYRGWWQATQQRYGSGELESALRFTFAGDEAAAAQARDRMVGQPIYREPVHQYLEPSSHFLARFAMAYDLLRAWDGLTPADDEALRAKLAAEAEHYYVAVAEVRGGQNPGNQRTLAAGALGLTALAMPGHPRAQAWLDRALEAIRGPENWWFFRPDGLFVEGHGYTVYMGLILVPFLQALDHTTGVNLFTDPTIAAWLRYHAHCLLPSGACINWGTTVMAAGTATLLPLVANRRHGGAAAPYYAWLQRAVTGSRLHPHLLLPALAGFDDTLPPDPAAEPPDRAFPTSAQVALRDAWRPDQTGVWLTGKGPGWLVGERVNRYGTYSHADATHFSFVAGGELLAVDSGYDHWKSRTEFAPEYHNLVLIDGQGPRQDTLAPLAWAASAPPVAGAAVQATYAGLTTTRVVVFADREALLCADFLAADGPHTYTWQLRAPVHRDLPAVATLPHGATWPGLDPQTGLPGRRAVTVRCAGPVATRLREGHWIPFADHLIRPNTGLDATWRATGATCLLTALVPHAAEAAPAVAASLDGDGQRLSLTTAAGLVEAVARADAGPLTAGGVTVTAQLLVVGSGPGGPRWTVAHGGPSPGLRRATATGWQAAADLLATEDSPAAAANPGSLK